MLMRDRYGTGFKYGTQGIYAHAFPSAYLDNVIPRHAQLRHDGIRLYDRKKRKGALHESITYMLVLVLVLLLWLWRLVVCEKKGNRERHFMSLLSEAVVLSRKKILDKLLARASMGSNGSIV